MFRKEKLTLVGHRRDQMKAKQAKAYRARLLDTFPALAPHMDHLMPRRSPVIVVKLHDHLEFIEVDGHTLFFQWRGRDAIFPTLRLQHALRDDVLLPSVEVDHGAVPFVLSGADVMAPGLVNTNARMDDNLEEGAPVAVRAKGILHAIAIGRMAASGADVRAKRKGIAVEVLHVLYDGPWRDTTKEAPFEYVIGGDGGDGDDDDEDED